MNALLVAEYIGIASAATSGFIFAVKRDCDWLGIFIASLLTALGGGFMHVCRPVPKVVCADLKNIFLNRLA